ncbi:MAG TPA: type II secretion system F family protein [Candidatus Tectomicrobia bacterium]|nr:type II secretion system F family protein [Candidatus Tectomicrobia bacterium]
MTTRTFLWEGRTRGGVVHKGEIEAESRERAIATLRQQHVVVTTIKAKPRALTLPGFGRRVSEKDLVLFTRQFTTMIDAGLPLVQCLDILSKQTENKSFGKTIVEIKKEVEGGATLADALRKYPRIFDDLYVNLVQAGEVGGVLDTTFARLAGYIEKARSLKGKVKSAMVYPAAIVFVSVSVIIFLMIFVIPVFAQMFQDFGGTLPWPTQFVIGVSNFVKNYILFTIPVLILAVFGFKQFYRTEAGKRFTHRTLLKTPIFGALLQKAAIARFSRTLSTLMGSGVPIIDSLDITARTAGNKVLEDAVLASIGSIKEGQTLATPLAKHRVFPPMVVQMVEIGDVTGELDSMLSKIADFYEEEVDRAVEALTAMLEPMMMVFLGTILGFIIVAMYLPIFKMASLIVE